MLVMFLFELRGFTISIIYITKSIIYICRHYTDSCKLACTYICHFFVPPLICLSRGDKYFTHTGMGWGANNLFVPGETLHTHRGDKQYSQKWRDKHCKKERGTNVTFAVDRERAHIT